MPCIFCEIIARRAPAKIIYQDDLVTAFHDAHPRAPTHILIVPNQHISSLDEVGEERTKALAAECLSLAARLARENGLSKGYRVVTNTGPDAGQSVFHLHFHLLAGRRLGWPPG